MLGKKSSLRKKSQETLNNITGILSDDDTLTARQIFDVTSKIKAGKTDKAMEKFDKFAKKRGMSEEKAEEMYSFEKTLE